MTYQEVRENYSMDLINMVDEETKDIIDYNRRFGHPKISYLEAERTAEARIKDWIETANEERVNLNFRRIACFVASSRRTKAWATFIGLAKLED